MRLCNCYCRNRVAWLFYGVYQGTGARLPHFPQIALPAGHVLPPWTGEQLRRTVPTRAMNIVIFRSNWLGHLVMSTPTLRSIRRHGGMRQVAVARALDHGGKSQ